MKDNDLDFLERFTDENSDPRILIALRKERELNQLKEVLKDLISLDYGIPGGWIDTSLTYNGIYYCNYCQSISEKPDQFDHAPDCPVKKAQELLNESV